MPSPDQLLSDRATAFGGHHRLLVEQLTGIPSPRQLGGQLLAKKGRDGSSQPLTKSGVSNAIRRTKDKGWILDSSTAQCLVVPPHAVAGGLGNADEACRAHRYQERRFLKSA